MALQGMPKPLARGEKVKKVKIDCVKCGITRCLVRIAKPLNEFSYRIIGRCETCGAEVTRIMSNGIKLEGGEE